MVRAVNWLRRHALRFVLGRRTYEYMVRSLLWDERLKRARVADIVCRKDAVEKRMEADWLRNLARIVSTPKNERLVKARRESPRDSAVGMPIDARAELR